MLQAETQVIGEQAYEPPADEPSDYLLLSRYRSGSQEAARHIYERYAKRLRAIARARCVASLANRVDADDIVQSVFGTFFQGARSGRFDIPDGEDLWKLILVLALNRIRAESVFHLAAKRDARQATTLESVPAVHATGLWDDNAAGFLKLVVDEALERLPKEHRVIVEKRIQGHGVADIAVQIGRSKRSVERILKETRAQLSILLDVNE